MQQYKQTLQYVRDNGVMRGDRTGKGRHGVFSPPDEIYDLSEGFPLTTLREISPKSMVEELLWFISGSTNLSDLPSKFFWKKWVPTNEDAELYAESIGVESDKLSEEQRQRVGTIGNLYGCSWRNAPAPVGNLLPIRKMKDLPKSLIRQFVETDEDGHPKVTVQKLIEFLDTDGADDTVSDAELKACIRGNIINEYWKTYDQLNELVYKIKTTPNSSRLRVSAYLTDYMAFEEFTPQENVMDGRACLTPCHTFFQCYVHPSEQEGGRGKLDLKLTLTSSDVPVGRIYNIAQYALLCSMLAQVCGLQPGRLIISTGDAHIYADQFDAVDTILSREPNPLPQLWLNPSITDIFNFTVADIDICDYHPHPAVGVPVAV